MASIKYDEYKVKLNNLRPTLDNLGQSLGLEAAAEELDLLQAQSAAEDFWSNMEKAQKVSQRIKNYIAFYLIDDAREMIYVIRFLYGKSNWASILKNSIAN